MNGQFCMAEVLDRLEERVRNYGIKGLSEERQGNLAMPRRIEFAAFLNRIAHAKFIVKK